MSEMDRISDRFKEELFRIGVEGIGKVGQIGSTLKTTPKRSLGRTI